MEVRQPDAEPPLHLCITGANRGIGHALTVAGLQRGHVVISASRSQPAVPPDLPGHLIHVPIELTEEHSIAAAAATILAETPKLDVLINNAGVHSQSRKLPPEDRCLTLETCTAQGMWHMFQVNAVAPLLLTRALLPALRQSYQPRVVQISSRKGSSQSAFPGGNYAYSSSKAALNRITIALAEDLLSHRITCVAMHPGEVKTDMGGPDATVPPEQCADALLDIIVDLTIAQTGQFLTWRGEVHPW